MRQPRRKPVTKRKPGRNRGALATREVLEQIELVQRSLQSVPVGGAAHRRLQAKVGRLLERLPEPERAPAPSLSTPALAPQMMELSGPGWVTRFPGSARPADCAPGFGPSLTNFLNALAASGASVHISATLRPPERAYLMHWSFKIANNLEVPENVPAMAGVAIEWVHRDAAGQPDLPKSRSLAKQMVSAFGIVAQPALKSRHTEGRAVDMTIRWTGNISIRDSNGAVRNISSTPRTGMNPDLVACGATYGVIKAAFANDPPHWSDDGH